jgi:hypothetical protein
MNVNDERIKKLTKALKNKKIADLTVLPWKHGVTDSLRHTAQFCRSQSKDFACISNINNKEYVTMPFDLYLKLLQSHKIAESLQEEQ